VNDGGLFGLLLVALAVGWVLGRYGTWSKRANPNSLSLDTGTPYTPSKHPLQLLFDSYNDEAIDAFLARIEVTSETLSLHLSIGRHFRQRGEVDRAILVHQNLLSHPQLSEQSTQSVIFELGADYKAAGLYDRAEALFQQLLESKSMGKKAQYELLTVLEMQGEWEEAISHVSRWDRRRDPQLARRLAHYYCELADSALESGARADAHALLRKARKASKTCSRIYLLNAKLYWRSEQYSNAISYSREAIRLSPEYSNLVLPILYECTEKTGSEQLLLGFLEQQYRKTESLQLLLSWLGVLEHFDRERAESVLREVMPKHLSVALLERLAKLAESDDAMKGSSTMLSVSSALTRLRESQPAYTCAHCGFMGKHLHWVCPSCRTWQSMAPYSN
jgi:lipopolysaccharide biosynthesis regulator YciM